MTVVAKSWQFKCSPMHLIWSWRMTAMNQENQKPPLILFRRQDMFYIPVFDWLLNAPWKFQCCLLFALSFRLVGWCWLIYGFTLFPIQLFPINFHVADLIKCCESVKLSSVLLANFWLCMHAGVRRRWVVQEQNGAVSPMRNLVNRDSSKEVRVSRRKCTSFAPSVELKLAW